VAAFVLGVTESRAGLPVLSLEHCEGPVPPEMPTCGHTDKEQELALFPGTSQNSVTLNINLMIENYKLHVKIPYFSEYQAHLFS
jgi:hypothetical protein